MENKQAQNLEVRVRAILKLSTTTKQLEGHN